MLSPTRTLLGIGVGGVGGLPARISDTHASYSHTCMHAAASCKLSQSSDLLAHATLIESEASQ